MDDKGIIRSPAAVIVFTIITCGIYALVWIYKFAKEIKTFLDEENISPGMELFLCIICYPYLIYWSYKYGKLIMEVQQRALLPVEDNSILYLVLAFFGLFIVDMAIMQDSVNKIWRKEIL